MLSEVIVNDIHVDLSADFSITIEKNSRLLQFEEIVDAWAYNISFPRTETNEAAFEHAERFQKRWEGWQEYPFQFYYNGRLILNGRIKAKYTGGKYEGYAYGTFGAIAAGYAGKMVKDVLNTGNLTYTNKAEYQPGEPYCLFPVYNFDFYKGRGLPAEGQDNNGDPVQIETRAKQFALKQIGTQNRFDSNTNLFIEQFGETTNKLAVITPFLFCNWFYVQLMASLDVRVVENALNTDSLLQRACFYTSYDITEVNLTVKTTIEIDQIDFGDITYNGGSVKLENQYERSVPSSFSPNHLLPDEWTVKDYILGIQNLLNVIFDFSPYKNEVRIRDREALLVAKANDLNDKLAEQPKLEPVDGRKVTIEYAKDSNDGFWNDYYQDISAEKWSRYLGEVASKSALDAKTGMKVGDFYYVLGENQYREYRMEEIETGPDTFEEELEWYPLSIYGHAYSLGSGGDEVKIESKFGVVSGWPDKKGRLMLTGNSDLFADEVKPFVPRIMFYQGLVNSVPRGDAMGGLVDNRWEGDNGLIAKRWGNTLNAIKNGVPGVAYFNFDEVDVQTLDLNEKHRIDEGEFIIEKCTTTFFANHVGTTEADIVKLA
ncbi:hypothetical protein [uncultured Sunxiuqinia sp.]|uniref:hypothetical protein n=1 Tax=uncultured Sunxiuqinia sp. TaxID=1573825 RepID=UPI0026138ACA|nr:hypothetical protein [uncultured Sunxiuqinia sp.]